MCPLFALNSNATIYTMPNRGQQFRQPPPPEQRAFHNNKKEGDEGNEEEIEPIEEVSIGDIPYIGERCSYVFPLYGNGGTTSDGKTAVVATGTTVAPIKLPENPFTRDDYRFCGWAFDENGGIVYADQEELMSVFDLCGIIGYAGGEEIPYSIDFFPLYAVWEKDTYAIRLHANLRFEGGEGSDGHEGKNDTEFVDQTFTYGEMQALMDNPFKTDNYTMGDVDVSQDFVGWSVGTRSFDWKEDGVGSLWENGCQVNLGEDDLRGWKERGAAWDVDGVPTLHLFAIWQARVTVEILPETVKNHVEFKLDNSEWHSSGEEVVVLPGKHELSLAIESGYGDYVSGWDVWQGGHKLDGDGGSVCRFDVSSKYGPKDTTVEVKMAWTTGRGEVSFQCVDGRTDAQKAVWAEWPGFPAFDAGKVRLTLKPQTGGGGRLEARPGEWEELPAGEYLLEAEYAETTGRRKFPFWEATSPRSVTVEAGKSQEVEVAFLPFGRDGAYSFASLTFDGSEGEVLPFEKMWYVHETTAFGYIDKFSENRLPTATRKGGWKFEGWMDWKGRKIESLDDLTASVKRWLNAEPPLRAQTFTAQWMNVTDAATGSGVAVPNAWLAEHAAEVLAANGGDYEAASVATASSGRAMWEYYVVGLDPASGEELKADIQWNDGKPFVKPLPELPEGRVVRIEARKSLAAGNSQEEWTDVTDVEDLEAEGWRFFRVGVELAE